MPKWTHGFFCFVWLGTAIVFGLLAHDSYESANTVLARFPVIDLPANMTALIVGIDVPRTMAAISNSNNQNATLLEKSIRETATLQLWLNSASAIFAIMGLTAQLRVYFYERRKERDEKSRCQ